MTKNDFSAMLFLRIIIALTISTTAAAAAASTNNSSNQDDLPFGFAAKPFAHLDLQQRSNNHSYEQQDYCVTLNNREFCTFIEPSCHSEAYQCKNGSTGTEDYDCGSTFSPLCSCSASWGGDPCICSVYPYYPYIFGPSVNCFEQDQTLIGYAAYAAAPTPDGKGETTTTTGGVLTYNIGFEHSPQFYFELQWQCPEDGGDNASSTTRSREECTCQAKYGDQECAVCQVCQDDDAGEWNWNCQSGYSADCNNNYTFWPQSSSKPGTSFHYVAVSIFWMVTLLLLLPLPP